MKFLKYLLIPKQKYLRVLIDQKFKRINGNKDINVNIRIISSTSKDLKNEVDLEILEKIYITDLM